VAYGLGQTDKFKGTGVWYGVEFEREKQDGETAANKKLDGSASPKKADKPTKAAK